MVKSSKDKNAKKRVKLRALATTKTKLTEKHLKKVKGGFTGGVFVAAGDIEGDGVASFTSGAVKKGR